MNFRETAENFLIAGLNPLPLKSNKAPNLLVGHNFLYETNSTLFNFDNISTHGIGVACGAVSENFMGIDFDCHKGQNIKIIFDSYCDCEQVKHLIKKKMISLYETPSGGFHIYFKSYKSMPGSVLSVYEDRDTMIEVRGNGQYVACSPMVGYKFLDGCDLTKLKVLDESIVEFLLYRGTIYNRDISAVSKQTGSLLRDEQREWPDVWPSDTPDGIYNNTESESARKLLLNAGWKIATKLRPIDNVEYWVRPGKSEKDGISATWGFKNSMFYVFSSNALPFKKETAYSPFMIMVALEYAGDWKKAKDDLREIYNLPKFESKPIPQVHEPEPGEISFPLDIFPQSYQNYINATYSALSFSKDFTACTMLQVISTCIGNKAKLQIKTGYIESPIFWMAIVGSRGANKTHPVSLVLDPLKKLEKVNYDTYVSQLNEYNHEETNKKIRKPQFAQTLVSDFTIEALHATLDYNKKGVLLYKDELIGFFKDMNKYKKSGGDEEFFLESFNNGSHRINRKTQDAVLLTNIFINIIGTIQDEVLSKMAADHTENGLLDRFLFSKTERLAKPLSRENLGQEHLDWWAHTVKTISTDMFYKDANDIVILQMDEPAYDYLLRLEEQYTDTQNHEDTISSLQTYYSKLRTYIKRFALLILIIEHFEDGIELIVTEDHVKKAERLIEYFSKTASEVFINNSKQFELKELLNSMKGKTYSEKILALHNKGIKPADIKKSLGKSRQYIAKIIASA